jgi:hypothetical protein
MTLQVDDILSAVTSHALASGYFDRVNTHEPKAAPGNGLTVAVWSQRVGAARGASGLNSTTALVVLNLRIFQNMLSEPQDAIDPNLMKALDALMAAYSGDFSLGGTVRNVDLLGQFGPELSAEAGYVDIDRKLFRVVTITLPLIVNDLWSQDA